MDWTTAEERKREEEQERRTKKLRLLSDHWSRPVLLSPASSAVDFAHPHDMYDLLGSYKDVYTCVSSITPREPQFIAARHPLSHDDWP